MTLEKDYVKVEITKFAVQTQAALLVHFKTPEGVSESCWVPISQLTDIHKNADGTGYIKVAKWIAVRKGMYKP